MKGRVLLLSRVWDQVCNLPCCILFSRLLSALPALALAQLSQKLKNLLNVPVPLLLTVAGRSEGMEGVEAVRAAVEQAVHEFQVCAAPGGKQEKPHNLCTQPAV